MLANFQSKMTPALHDAAAIRLNGPDACGLCPRGCGARPGYCGEDALRIASAVIHKGEEPPVTGRGGSGAIFVTGCNLRCVFCQNAQVSRQGMGREVSAAEFASICLALQEKGAENINIVTGSHAAAAIADGMRLARAGGLALPFLWNSSAYERPETLELLRGLADMFLPDLKTLDAGIAAAFLNAGDYPAIAERAIFKMMEMAGSKDAVIIRHLMLPGFAEATRDVLRWFADNAAGKATLSLMTQYTPVVPPVGTGAGADTGTLKAPRRFVSEAEYEAALSWLEEFGIEDGFYQELEHDGDWLPDFSRTNPFPSELSVPVWHWKQPREGGSPRCP